MRRMVNELVLSPSRPCVHLPGNLGLGGYKAALSSAIKKNVCFRNLKQTPALFPQSRTKSLSSTDPQPTAQISLLASC